MSDIMQLDLYAILGVEIGATEKELLRAYRKSALKCHPDKNKDNPKAAEKFHELSRALEILSDKNARSAYDKVIRAKQKTKIRHREMDSKRRKLKDDLEARERAAGVKVNKEEDAGRSLAREIERLRREGSRLLEKEKQRMTDELKHNRENLSSFLRENNSKASDQNEPIRLKVKWKGKSPDNYCESDLHSIFSKYGKIAMVLLSSKKNNAIVEFECITTKGVEQATGRYSELSIKWISGKPDEAEPVSSTDADNTRCREEEDLVKDDEEEEEEEEDEIPENHEDFEMQVLMRMQQAHANRKH